jgi:hypothetical protein
MSGALLPFLHTIHAYPLWRNVLLPLRSHLSAPLHFAARRCTPLHFAALHSARFARAAHTLRSTINLALVSWNYSFHNLLSPLLASLFAGNSCVIKCSEQVAWSSAWFFGGVRKCLEACGHDPEVVQLVICLPEVAETVTRNPLVRHITCERRGASSAFSPSHRLSTESTFQRHAACSS